MLDRICTVRLAKAEDSAAILQCLSAAFEPYRTRYTPEAFEDTILTPETLQHRFSLMTIFAAADASGRIVGTIACHLPQRGVGHIRGMAVLPDWQGSGVAAQLLSVAESELHYKGCSTITLNTTQPLQQAMRFYEKHGYRPTGEVKKFFGMPLFGYVKNVTG